MLRELARSANTQITIPDVRAERCVHTIIEQSRCRACVNACPTGAWIIDDEMLGIDPKRCDACDLCVAACTEAAIVQRFRPEVCNTPHGNVALACCAHAQVEEAEVPRMPCLHAIGISDLFRLARDQVLYLVTTAGDCDRCSRGKGERLEDRLRSVNALLSCRGLPPIVHRTLDATRWRDTWHQVDLLAKQNRVSRRNFFRSAAKEPSKRVEEVIDRAEGRFIPPGSLLPSKSSQDVVPFAPHIDPAQCSGCDACARLCPHKAILVEIEGGLPNAYIFVADQCSGCGICTDLCEQDAISILHWQPVIRERIPLTNRSCRACGVTYHLPQTERSRSTAEDLCTICDKADHHKNLFQVMD